ncbi:MAG: GDSL-type esterase/lipase family protein [Nannocystaceae bacterium]
MATNARGPTGLMDEDGRGEGKVALNDAERAPEPGSRVTAAMLVQIGPAMIAVVACIVTVYLVPALQDYRPWVPGDPVPFWNVLGRPFEDPQVQQETQERVDKVDTIAREALADEPEPQIVAEREVVEADVGSVLPPYEPHPDDDKAVEQSVELFTGHELDHYFEVLARADAGYAGQVARAVHWGDSAIGVDGITSAIRKRLQARFGDGGHGFHVMAPPNTSYRHRGIRFRHNDQWGLCFIIQKCRSDGHYGLGGTTTSSSGGAQSWFAPDPKHSSGHVSRFELYYAARPRGGRLKLQVDDQEPVYLETAAEQLEDRLHVIEVEDGPHELSVRASGGGRVRTYGVALERDGPGAVWDGLALVGAFQRRMLEYDPEHLRGQLRMRRPQLAVLMFGGNDMIRKVSMETYEQEVREVLRLLKTASPQMDCLVMAPLDHGQRKGMRIESLPVVAPMVQAQRRAAEAEGCAFFDTYMAMGGEGAAGRWNRQSPRLIGGDLGHLTASGHIVVGEMFYRALMEAYVAYRREGQ